MPPLSVNDVEFGRAERQKLVERFKGESLFLAGHQADEPLAGV